MIGRGRERKEKQKSINKEGLFVFFSVRGFNSRQELLSRVTVTTRPKGQDSTAEDFPGSADASMASLPDGTKAGSTLAG
jgi:hypothetical protein